jgi:hypothetical protein
MRGQTGMEHPVEVSEIFALAVILVAVVFRHVFSSILARLYEFRDDGERNRSVF